MGPENRFIHRVNGIVPKEIHREKMHNAYRGGTPDVWYSGARGDLWAEYKWQTVPKSGLLVPELSPLQLDWCTKRYSEGRSVVVIVGTPKGALWLSDWYTWKDGQKLDEEVHFHTDQTVADFIRRTCS